jgi:O-acetylhomoserine (thiol)-lyase
MRRGCFGLQEFGNIYTRIMNPTTDVFEKRIAALEGGVAGLATASGQAAETLTLIRRWPTRARRLSRPPRSTVERTTCSITRCHGWASRCGLWMRTMTGCARRSTSKTRAVYTETLGNPKLDVVDIERMASIAHEHGLPLVIDNTSATPALVRPIEWGADIVVNRRPSLSAATEPRSAG